VMVVNPITVTQDERFGSMVPKLPTSRAHLDMHQNLESNSPTALFAK
jgi:hypothetical protein